jgi:RNA polymerase sigma-70 factor (ECF subfamily)
MEDRAESEVDRFAGDLEDLLAALAGGKDAALAALYDLTHHWVYGLISGMVGDAHAAEDALLDTYVQVWRRAGSYEPRRGSPAAWLTMLARSRAMDLLRSRAARKRRETPLPDGFEAAACEAGPETSSACEEEREVMLRALAAIPREQRIAIELAFFQGLSHFEIARRLEQPAGTIKTRIRLGMMKLRRFLEPAEERS